MDEKMIKKTTKSLMILIFLVALEFATAMMAVITTFNYTTVNGKELITTIASRTSYIWTIVSIILVTMLAAALVSFIIKLKKFKAEMKKETSSAKTA
ncbi:hypothetical protein OXIME_000473 [Oxyplasma meridianum]|uniref:Uncharacterized protein n=1 Tax=Oxyplasma meridianum TaxID=3073602 RepID=A0AAX4NFI2_9ARCH